MCDFASMSQTEVDEMDAPQPSREFEVTFCSVKVWASCEEEAEIIAQREVVVDEVIEL